MKFVTNIKSGTVCIGAFKDIDALPQFTYKSNETDLYVFKLGDITVDGVQLINIVDNMESVIPFDSINKIKSTKTTDGGVLTVDIYVVPKPMDIGNMLVENGGSTDVTIFDDDGEPCAVTIAGMSIVGGAIEFRDAGGAAVAPDQCYIKKSNKIFG